MLVSRSSCNPILSLIAAFCLLALPLTATPAGAVTITSVLDQNANVKAPGAPLVQNQTYTVNFSAAQGEVVKDLHIPVVPGVSVTAPNQGGDIWMTPPPNFSAWTNTQTNGIQYLTCVKSGAGVTSGSFTINVQNPGNGTIQWDDMIFTNDGNPQANTGVLPMTPGGSLQAPTVLAANQGIPAASTWGLIALAAALLGGGSVYVLRQRIV